MPLDFNFATPITDLAVWAPGKVLAPPGVSLGFLNLPGASWSLLGLPAASWSFLVHPGASWSFLGLPGASWGFLGLPGVSWSFLKHPGASWDLLGLATAIEAVPGHDKALGRGLRIGRCNNTMNCCSLWYSTVVNTTYLMYIR